MLEIQKNQCFQIHTIFWVIKVNRQSQIKRLKKELLKITKFLKTKKDMFLLSKEKALHLLMKKLILLQK